MNGKSFIAVDWGTSCLKAFLCRYLEAERPDARERDGDCQNGAVQLLDQREGKGIGRLQGPVPDALFAVIEPWVTSYGKLPLLLSGMAGSNIGWVTTPYVPCPVAPRQLLRACHCFEYAGHKVAIVPGASSPDKDLMRGEELQISGWLRLQKNTRGNHLVCLPGTHTKWVLVRDGNIETFVTALTGELFALLQEHSVLLKKKTSFADNREIFLQGVRQLRDNPDASLIHQLFRVRSQQICGTLREEEARSYLSGLLIGADVRGAVNQFRSLLSVLELQTVSLLGNENLCRLFADALDTFGYSAVTSDVTEVTLAGFTAAYESVIHAEEKI